MFKTRGIGTFNLLYKGTFTKVIHMILRAGPFDKFQRKERIEC